MKNLSANGANIPVLGLGTWDLRGETASNMVRAALDGGYSHVDTAAYYENEQAVGEGIKASSRARDQIFLTTKVWPTEVREGDFQRSVEASLKRLDVDHLDLLLIHWPPARHDFREWARLLNDAVERGWTRHIGVSNFTLPLFSGIVEASERPIAVNQVENHPYLDQSRMRDLCARHGVALVAYCPLFRGGDLFEEASIVEAGKAHGKTAAQIVLRWHIQQGGGAIPKTATPARLAENIDVFDFELSEDEMKAISALVSRQERICDFEFSPDWD